MEKSIENQKIDNHPVHWIEAIVQKIERRNSDNIILVSGKTPSGHIHLGIMRELLICEALFRIFKNKNKSVRFILFFDCLDAAKRFPGYIPKEFAQKYIGIPYQFIPNPFIDDNRSYAEVFGEELASTFPEIGISVEIIWTHDLYKTDDMKEMIKIGLKKNDLVKEIVAKYLTASMNKEQKDSYLIQQKNWMGAMIICEKCQRTQKKLKDGSIVPNRVLSYNEQTDECTYHCPNCDYKNSIKISSGRVKLNWRLDWPAKWKIFNTICEPAGKDHSTPGGSYDTGLELCQRVYGYEGPIKVPYEWVRLGDRDMKTSKGIVFTPKRFLEIADPEILRMLIYQTNINKHLSIRIEELEQYYNEYDRIEKIYFGINPAASEQEKKEINYLYPHFQVKSPQSKCPVRLPFKYLTVLAQLLPIFGEKKILLKAQEYLRNDGRNFELQPEFLEKSLTKISNWLDYMKDLIEKEKNPSTAKKLRNKVILFSIPKVLSPQVREILDGDQKEALKLFLLKIQKISKLTEENIKDLMIQLRNELDIKTKKIFQGFYLIFLGEKKGPRLGPFLSMFDKSWIEERIKESLEK